MSFKDSLFQISNDLLKSDFRHTSDDKLEYYVQKRLTVSLNNYAQNIQDDIDYLMSKNSKRVGMLLLRKENKAKEAEMKGEIDGL